MSKNGIIGLVVIIVIAIGGYFLGKSQGWIGGPTPPTAEEVTAYLQGLADEVGTEGKKIDDFSRYEDAKLEGTTLTRTIRSLLDKDKVSPDYHQNRIAMVKRTLCEDETAKAMLEAGAIFAYEVKSADDQPIGSIQASKGYCG
ncbi:hypothetical protein [Frigidibacter sp. ROC022]|uniref:hypothetical protein n=1 Tax=Frigidibacter sp. ROC022 TaxID=2971796 RepID=UPI00215AC41A|nr:hypothetical protein [Frigidibacter sp. ROC022]MCR8725331.1 hypothetical protein [Frigidibacter sp. ROC022]